MTLRERILAVYRGETPDVVPYMLDLSHWFYHRNTLPWDISKSYKEPEYKLIDFHRRMGAGFYMPNLASFYSSSYGGDVRATTTKESVGGTPQIRWRLETPLGAIERVRIWDDATYAWAIGKWGVETEQDLKVLGHALGSLTFKPKWPSYDQWNKCVGDGGVVYMPLGYSGMGHLLNYWMGIERTIYGGIDWNDTMHQTVDQINESNLLLVDLVTHSPAEIVIMGDNFSSEIQPPHFFAEWSKPFYTEAIRRLHKAGKYVAVHIDGKLHGSLQMIAECGADCADAVTPKPMGDLTPAECRAEAGDRFILSGGVAPTLWLSNVSDAVFKKAVLEWLDLRKKSPRFIANAGDQVPPGAVEDRIAMMRDLVEEHGRY
jgi:hypothetical protein